MDTDPLIIGSVFTGIGGFEIGFDIAFGGEHRAAFYIEREAYPLAVLGQAISRGLLPQAPIWPDANSFPAGRFYGLVDILLAGYPCQPFSDAGQKTGHDDARNGWPALFKIIKEVRPPICFLENVEGHIRCGFRDVVTDLESIGYGVDGRITSAREVCAPHHRKRLFCRAFNMADTDGVERITFRLQAGGEDGEKGTTQGSVSPSCLLVQKSENESREGNAICNHPRFFYPAGFDEWGRWEKVPASARPVIFREADGVSQELHPHLRDRVAALGNAVLPVQAAYALRALVRGEGVAITAGEPV